MSNPELIPPTAHPTMAGLRLLRLRWKLIALLGIAGLLGGIAYYAWMPMWFEAELLIAPKRSASDMSPVKNLLGNLPVDLAGASSLSQSEPDRIAAILASRSVTDAMIAKFDLVHRYGASRIEQARKAVWSHCATAVDKKPNLIRLTCEDTDPEVARDLTNALGQAADAVFRRIAVSSAGEERAFLEKRVTEARHDLEDSSDALRQFQESHKVIDLPEQGKAVVSAMATLEGDLISKRLELSYARGFASNDEASVAQLRRQIAILSAELQTLEDKRPAEPGGGSAQAGTTAASAPGSGSRLFPPAMEVPALRAQLESLFREHKIRETVFVMLTERYEARKLDEARDLSTFVVVDDAALPSYRIRPTRRVLPVGLLAGILFGIAIAILPVWWTELRRRAALEASSGPAGPAGPA
jgi:capsule polysaccharide export protein KpsE/RkpR